MSNKNEDILTVSFQNGRYEIVDFINGGTVIGKKNIVNENVDLTVSDVLKTAEDILKKYEKEKT